MNSTRRVILTLSFIIACVMASSGSESPPSLLTDEFFFDRLLQNKHVAHLMQAIPSRKLVCWVDGRTPTALELYLGDDEKTHATRIGAYRVTTNGRVWINRDPTLLTDDWAEIH